MKKSVSKKSSKSFKFLFSVAVLAMFCCGSASCKSKKSKKGDVQNSAAPGANSALQLLNKSADSKAEKKAKNMKNGTKKSSKPFGIDEERYDELIQKSFVSLGNNARIKKVIEKMRSGQDVYICALGGSVTEGAGPADFKDGYAYQTVNRLKELYTSDGGAHVHFDNAGLSGTPSELGLVRYESDVVEVLGQQPDLLIIEFAVNDDGKDGSTRAFEALIRNALLKNDDCAVIALYSAATYGNSAAAKQPVAAYYEIPQVNVLALVSKGIAGNDFTKEQYYTDTVHPTKAGHTIQTDCILNIFAKADAAALDQAVSVPSEWKTLPEKAFTNFTRITGDNADVKITAGSFSGTDSKCQALKKNNKSDFPQNWHSNGDAQSFVMKINCKSLIFVYKEQGNWEQIKYGQAEVFVDGQSVGIYDGGAKSGWNNCVPKLIIDGSETKEHTVEVKPLDGKPFTIVAMGYSK